MKKKILALLMAGAMSASLCACGSTASTASTADTSSAEESSAAESTAGEAAESDQKYTIGICQLMQHDALDAATQGFEDALTELLGSENVTFDLQNAQGDSTTCSTICTGFASGDYDLIMANATPALQAAVAATTDIPILATSVTDYATALANDSLDPDAGTGINVSGTSDGVAGYLYADLVMELVPDAKNVSIIYCSAEANSVVQADDFIEAMKESHSDVTCTVYTFADSNDMQAVVTSAVENCDALYIPTDNTAASNMTIVRNVCEPNNIPVICGEENMTSLGGLATVSISYYDIGYKTGEMAYDILVNGADVSTMAIEYAPNPVKEYNADYASAINFTIPDGFTAIGG